MIKKCGFKKYVIAFIAIIALTLSFASCGKGSLKLEAFKIDYTTITTTYIVGQEVDFSGIQATAIYTDESLNKVLTYEDLTFTYDDDITATPGEKEILVSFEDPYLNKTNEFTFNIKVLSDLSVGLEYPVIAIGFDRPTSLVSFISNNHQAGKSEYGSPSFSSEFAAGDQKYVIGNENEFKLNPQFAIFDNDGEIRILDAFYSVIDITINRGGMNIKLTKKDVGENLVTYSYQGKDIVTVNTYSGTYQFTEDAAGEEIKISVLPDEEYYICDDFKAITLEAKIIQAYNVYEAWQLSVIDNDPAATGKWDDIKKEHGIYGLNVSGVVLHNNLKITADDVPDSFFKTTTSEVVYTNAFTGEKTIVPAGTKYLYDYSFIYRRRSVESFSVNGNMFTLDFSDFPLVPSSSVFGPDAALHFDQTSAYCFVFKFEVTNHPDDEVPANVETINVKNLSIIGNASRNNLLDEAGNMVSCGGIMFMATDNHSQSVVENVIGNSFFCTYRVDGSGDMIGKNLKSYDAYLNFFTVMVDSTLTVTDSYFNGSGGPAVLAINNQSATKFPNVTMTNTICDTALTGRELWFTQMGITAFLPQVFDLSNKMTEAGLGSFTNDKGQMNGKGVLTTYATNPEEILQGIDAQGKIFFDTDGIDRSASNKHWNNIYTLGTAGVVGVGMSPLFITANDSNGNPTTIWYDGTNLRDLSGAIYQDNAKIKAAFNNADTITLTIGGVSIVAAFYH